MPPTASWLPVSPSRRSRLTRVGSSSRRDYGPGCAAASRNRKGFRCGGRPPHDQGAMLNGRRCPLNSSPERPTFPDITPRCAGRGRIAKQSGWGRCRDCEAIRVRGRCRDSEPSGNAAHPDSLPGRGEREQNCSSLAGPLRGAHALMRMRATRPSPIRSVARHRGRQRS
jgi:hypothetical protein